MKKISNNTPAVKAPIYAKPSLKSQAEIVETRCDVDDSHKGIRQRSLVGGYGFVVDVEFYIEDKPVFGDDMDPNQKQVIARWPAFDGQQTEDWPFYLQVVRRQNGRNNYSWLNLNRLTDRSYVDFTYPDEFRRIMTECYSNIYERIEALRGCVIKCVSPTTINSFKFGSERGKILLDENGQKMTELVDTVAVECTMKKLSADMSKVFRVA